MKLLLFLCFVLAASEITAYVAEETDIVKLTKEMNEYVTECIEEGKFELNADDITAIFKDDQKTKDIEKEGMEQVTRCFFHKAGILEPDGKLNPDAAMAILTLLSMEKDDAEELLQNCTSITGFDGQDTTYAIFKCFNDGVKS